MGLIRAYTERRLRKVNERLVSLGRRYDSCLAILNSGDGSTTIFEVACDALRRHDALVSLQNKLVARLKQ